MVIKRRVPETRRGKKIEKQKKKSPEFEIAAANSGAKDPNKYFNIVAQTEDHFSGARKGQKVMILILRLFIVVLLKCAIIIRQLFVTYCKIIVTKL